jgi:hypothetical protein
MSNGTANDLANSLYTLVSRHPTKWEENIWKEDQAHSIVECDLNRPTEAKARRNGCGDPLLDFVHLFKIGHLNRHLNRHDTIIIVPPLSPWILSRDFSDD